MDSIGARDIRLRLAIGKPLERFLTLVGSQLRRTAKPDSTGLCTASALCAGTDQLALELSQKLPDETPGRSLCSRMGDRGLQWKFCH